MASARPTRVSVHLCPAGAFPPRSYDLLSTITPLLSGRSATSFAHTTPRTNASSLLGHLRWLVGVRNLTGSTWRFSTTLTILRHPTLRSPVPTTPISTFLAFSLLMEGFSCPTNGEPVLGASTKGSSLTIAGFPPRAIAGAWPSTTKGGDLKRLRAHAGLCAVRSCVFAPLLVWMRAGST